MSDANPDVVPEESVVDFPSSYEGPEADAEPEGNAEADAPAEEEPVSLDEPEADAEEAEADGEAENSEESEGDEPEEEVELIEFDFGGNKLEVNKAEVPPELAETLDKFAKDIWADYTKKSQGNADTAKSLNARAEALEKIEGLSAEALDAFTKGKSIKLEIEQLSSIDMVELWRSNPDQARQVSDRLSAKQAELQSIVNAVDQYETELSKARQAELERRSDEGRQILDRKYKGFSNEIAPKLEAYAVEHGMTAKDAGQWAANPTVAEFAYKAMLYDQMQAAGKPKSAPKKASPVKSMPNKGGNKHAANPNDMSFSELGKLLEIN